MGSPAPESELGPNALLDDPPPWHNLELVRPPSTSAEPPPGFSAESPGELLRSTVPYLLPSPAAYSPAPSPSSSPRFERMPVTISGIEALRWIVGGAIGGLLLIMALLWVCFYINKQYLSRGPPESGQQNVPPPTDNRPLPIGNWTRIFTYEELERATENFSDENVLGEGGFGKVYKGSLPDGSVAIKQRQTGSRQGEREFTAEVDTISRVHHRNLVRLVGYCMSEDHRLLVYEFVPNRTLQFHLHEPGRPVLSWQNRMKIARGSARGLAYLHEDCQPPIIHRDIKAANILIDESFEPKIADFGLAKFFLDTNTHVTTRIMGTHGYIAPEYEHSGKLTEKSDTFSFGVMLLELITGNRPIHENTKLVHWARPRLSQALKDGNFTNLVVSELEYDDSEMKRIVVCAAACVRTSGRDRPQMTQIARALEGNLPLKELNEGIEPWQSRADSCRNLEPGSSQSNDDMKNAFDNLVRGIGEHGSSAFMTARDQNPSGPSAKVVESRKQKAW